MTSHEDVQAEISTRLDGEPGALADDIYQTHLANCSECREYLREAHRLQGLLLPGQTAAGPQPELTDLILQQVEPEWRRVAGGVWLRVVLARVALVVMAVLHVAWGIHLLGASAVYTPAIDEFADPRTGQLLVEAAAVRMALAAGLCFSAWRPQVLLGLLPVAGGLALFRLGFYVRDWAMGVAGEPELWSELLLLLTAAVVTWGYLVTTRLGRLRSQLSEWSARPAGA